MAALPVGFRPNAREVVMMRRATADLSCTRSDLLRAALNSFLLTLSSEGLVSLPPEQRPALARRS